MRVYNPIWLQVIFYLGIIAFPFLSGYMFYQSYDLYLKSNLLGAALFMVMGLGVSYISYIGVTLAKFVPAEMVFNEEQFTVTVHGSAVTYDWQDIASTKNYQSSQILKLFDKSGKVIYVVDYMTPGYKCFAAKLNDVVVIK